MQIPHQDGMLPLVSTMPLHNLHFLLSESIYRQQHVCSNLVTLKDLQGISGERGTSSTHTHTLEHTELLEYTSTTHTRQSSELVDYHLQIH